MRSTRQALRIWATALALSATVAPAWADASLSSLQSPSQISALSVVSVPLALSEGVSDLSVQGVRRVGDVLELSVKGAGHASAFAIRVPAAVAGGLSIMAGTAIEVSTDGVGHLLRVSGKIIGFIPNELGRSLLRHSPIGHGGIHHAPDSGRPR